MPVCPCPAFVLTTSNLLTPSSQRPNPPTNDPVHDVSLGKGQGRGNPSRSGTKINLVCSGKVSRKKWLFFWILSKLPRPPLPQIWTTYTTFLTPACQKNLGRGLPLPIPSPKLTQVQSYKYFDLKSLERFCKSFEDSKHFSAIVSILTCSSLVNLSYILVYWNSSGSLLSVGWLDQVVNNKSIKPQ